MNAKVFTIFFLVVSSIRIVQAQEEVMVMAPDTMHKDKKCCELSEMKEKNCVTAEYRYYLSPAQSTVTELSASGFLLDEPATEIGVKFGQFPKIFYYQQLGTLSNTNYSSIYGLGLKEKYQHDFIKNPSIIVAPYIEIGVGFYQLTMVRNINNNSFTSPANGQLNETRFDNFSGTGDLGLNVGYTFHMLNTRISIIANGGYLTNLPSNWKTGHSLAFKEKLDLSSLYVGGKISLGVFDCCKH